PNERNPRSRASRAGPSGHVARSGGHRRAEFGSASHASVHVTLDLRGAGPLAVRDESDSKSQHGSALTDGLCASALELPSMLVSAIGGAPSGESPRAGEGNPRRDDRVLPRAPALALGDAPCSRSPRRPETRAGNTPIP